MIMKRLTNLLLVFVVLVFSVVRGNAKCPIDTKKVRSIAVVQMAQLGDMVCTTHVFHHIKNKYPNARLYVVGKAANEETLKYNKDVDEYVVFSEDDIWTFYKFLKKTKIDVGILTATHFRALAVLFLSGVKHIIAPTVIDGYSPFETKTYRMIRWLFTIISISTSKNVHEEYLKLLCPLDINETSTERHLEFSKEAKRKAAQFFAKHDISPADDFVVGIFPSSGNKIKNWPGDRFAQVADHVYKKYKAKIIVIGGPNDTEEVSEMLNALDPQTKVINTLNLFTIDELKAVIALMSMFISVDAGPLNFAIALNVSTVDILGPVPEFAVKVGKFNRAVANRGGAAPAVHSLNTREINFKEARRQAKAIPVEMVIHEVDALYTAIQGEKID